MEKLRRAENRRVQISWEEVRKAQMTWDEMRTAVISWEEPRKGEKTWDEIRWDEMKWDEMVWKTLRNTTWHEMRWDGMTQTAVTMGCHEQVPRKATTRWDLMIIWWNKKRLNFEKIWHQNKSRDCCCEAQQACLHLEALSLFRSIGYWPIQFWNFRPRLARALLVWK